MKRLAEIFWVFFKIGLFTIGGGYAMLPIIQKEVVETKGWMTDEEFLDAISLTNSLPGPLATNSATFVGYRVARAPGSLAAVLGPVLLLMLVLILLDFLTLAKQLDQACYVLIPRAGHLSLPALLGLSLAAVLLLRGLCALL